MESFLEDLKRQVHCSLCNDRMIKPKLLKCFHTFCKYCIKTYANFKCPKCTSLTEIQELNDVEDLQTSPIHSRILQVLSVIENQKICSVSASHSDALWQCLDCDRSLCDECRRYHTEFTKDHKVVALSEMTKKDIEAMLKKESPCKTHASQDVELYCRDCDELICFFCSFDDQHKKHIVTSLHEFIAAKKDYLSENLQEIQKIDTDEKEKKQQEEIALDIKRDGEQAQEQVKKLTKKLVKKLIDDEQKLLNGIQKSITKADRNLRIIHHTPSAQEYIKYFIQNGTASEIIDLRSDTEFKKRKEWEMMIFQSNEELFELDNGVGLMRPFKMADPRKSSVEVIGPNNFEAMTKATLSVIMLLRPYEDDPFDTSLDDVTIHITPDDNVKIGEKRVTADGHIQVTFTPLFPGQLTAEVQVHGNPVSNSPLVIDVKPQHIKEMMSKLKNALNTGSKDFAGIAVNRSNTKIAVTDWKENCVRVFNMDGDLLLSYYGAVSGRVKLKNACGLAFLDETDLVISYSNDERMGILNTTSGRLTRTFGFYVYDNLDFQFAYPNGVYVDDHSNIIVCDRSNHRVQVFTNKGDCLYRFTIPGEDKAYDVVKHNGLFYVSAGSVVHVIEMKDNQSPTTVNTIGGEDYTDGRLHDATGLAIDINNNLLVCDCESNQVYKFTLNGRFVGKTSKLDYKPNFITVLNDGQIICSSYGPDGVRFLR